MQPKLIKLNEILSWKASIQGRGVDQNKWRTTSNDVSKSQSHFCYCKLTTKHNLIDVFKMFNYYEYQ